MSAQVLEQLAEAVHEAEPARTIIINGGWTRRVGAVAIDVVFMLLFAFLPTLCITFIHLDRVGMHPELDIAGEWIALASMCFFSLVYLLSDVIFGSSIGKWELRIRIAGAEGETTCTQRLVRWSLKVLPLFALFVIATVAYIGLNRHQKGHPLPEVNWFRNLIRAAIECIPLTLLIVDVGWICFDSRRRPLHDCVAGTLVGQQVRSTRSQGFEPLLGNPPMHDMTPTQVTSID